MCRRALEGLGACTWSSQDLATYKALAFTFTLTHDTCSTSQWMAVAVFAARQRPPGAPGRLHRAERLRPQTMLTAPKAMPYSASLRCCQRLVLVRHLGYASTDRTASCGVKGFASGIAEVANPTETRQSPVFATNVTRTTCVTTTFVLCHTTCRAPQKMLAAKQTEADCLSPACWSQQSPRGGLGQTTGTWNIRGVRCRPVATNKQRETSSRLQPFCLQNALASSWSLVMRCRSVSQSADPATIHAEAADRQGWIGEKRPHQH